ncbi:MAG: hypothetical protein IH606_11175 [Burkholderiales bacterium]|nr:hypothetical protein [Burkholderiales bacterium]
MYAIVYKADGFPICVQVAGVVPDPVVVWTTEGAAKSFIDSKGGSEEFQPVAVDDGSLDAIAKAMGCPVDQITLEPYPS